MQILSSLLRPLRPWLPLAAAVAIAVVPPRASLAAFRFDTAFESLPSVASATRLVAFDIDEDGVTDLVVSGSTNQLMWHRGLPSGGFAPVAPLLTLPGVVYDFAVGDINGDARPDLVVADGTKTAWSVLGNGDGTFQSPRAFLSLFTCRALALTDLDQDGHLDIVALDTFSPMYAMKGLGDGRFQLVSIITLLGMPMSMAVADFDGDSLPDVLVGYDFYQGTGHFQGVYYHRGLPGLTLAPPVLCVGGITPARIRTADLDEDGLTDAMILRNSGIATLYGTRGTTPSAGAGVAAISPADAYVADLDGDGHSELAISVREDPLDAIAIQRRGPGRDFVRVTDFPAGRSPGDLVFVDVDHDGRLDAVAANPSTSSLAVVRARGVLAFGNHEEIATGSKTWDLSPGDVDRDGRQDVVVAQGNYQDPHLGVHPGAGDGSFRAPLLSPGDYGVGRVELGDVNGDGLLDVIASEPGDMRVRAFFGDGTGHFAPGTARSFSFPSTLTYRQDIAVADFDEDGMDDAVIATDSGLEFLPGDATEGLGVPVKIGPQMKCVVAADLDRDGHADLLATNSMRNGDWGSAVNVYLGHGDGMFTTLPTFYAGYKPFALAVSDLTSDGIPDLVVANWGDGNIAVLRGVGDGTFTSTFTIAGVLPTAIALADCDRDGRPDLVAGMPAVSGIEIWPGLGDGTFGVPEIFGCRNSPDALRCRDLDDDGLPDILIGHWAGSEFDVLINRTSGPTTPTLVSVVEARADGGHVRITWASDWPALATARVQRGVRGVWQDAGRVSRSGADRLVFEEDVADGEYDYRLAVDDGGALVTLGDVHVAVRTARRLELTSCAWDESGSVFRVVLSIPGTGAAHLVVVDLMGRVIARSDLTPTGAATQSVLLPCDRPAPSGFYWVRLEHAGRAVSRKVMVLR
jgi:hypothetical protein